MDYKVSFELRKSQIITTQYNVSLTITSFLIGFLWCLGCLQPSIKFICMCPTFSRIRSQAPLLEMNSPSSSVPEPSEELKLDKIVPFASFESIKGSLTKKSF